MLERRVPESVKVRLRRKLSESVRDKGVFSQVGMRERIRRRLRGKLQESRVGLRDSIRDRLRSGRLFENRDRLRESIRNRLRNRRLFENRLRRRRLFESRGSDVGLMLRNRLRRRLFENRVGLRESIRNRLRRSLLENRLRGRRLFESGDKLRDSIRDRLRRRLFENRVLLRRGILEDNDNVRKRIRDCMRNKMRIRSRERFQESGVGLRDRLRRRLYESRVRRRLLEGRERSMVRFMGMGELGERRNEVLKRRNEVLERELRRKTRLLKEAYKVVRRVEELGGIHKIESAMRLAHDTIVKAGTKLFKEAVSGLSVETGVERKKVAGLVKKVGFKEARDILKRRKEGRRGDTPKTIIVEGIDSRREQFPVLGVRLVERLSKSVEAGNPGDLKQLGASVFKKIAE